MECLYSVIFSTYIMFHLLNESKQPNSSSHSVKHITVLGSRFSTMTWPLWVRYLHSSTTGCFSYCLRTAAQL